MSSLSKIVNCAFSSICVQNRRPFAYDFSVSRGGGRDFALDHARYNTLKLAESQAVFSKFGEERCRIFQVT
jgi:hypothetical protein